MIGGVPALALDTLVKGSVVIAGAALLACLLRRRSAAARHAVWTVALLSQLALPILSLMLPAWRLPLLPRAERPPVAPAEVAPLPAGYSHVVSSPVADVAVATAPPTVVASGLAAPAAAGIPATIERTRRSVSGVDVLAALWLLGAALVLVRLLVGAAKVAGLARRADEVRDDHWLALSRQVLLAMRVRRPVRLLRGDRLPVPVTWGVLSPVVLLPRDSDAWSPERRLLVLTHEIAHVKRLDALTQLVGQVTLALYWMNPLAWLAVRRMRLERERACDDYVLRGGIAASTYAEELLEMVQTLNTTVPDPAFAALALARRSEFEGRVLSILDPQLRRHALGRRGAAATALGALVVVPLAVLRPVARELPPAEEPPAPVAAPTPVAIVPQTVVEPLPAPKTSGAPSVKPESKRRVTPVVARPAMAIMDEEPAMPVVRAAMSEPAPAERATVRTCESKMPRFNLHTSRTSSRSGAVRMSARLGDRTVTIAVADSGKTAVGWAPEKRDAPGCYYSLRVDGVTVLASTAQPDGGWCIFIAEEDEWPASLMNLDAREADGAAVPVTRLATRDGAVMVAQELEQAKVAHAKVQGQRSRSRRHGANLFLSQITKN